LTWPPPDELGPFNWWESRRNEYEQPPPSQASVDGRAARLWSTPDALAYFRDERGLWNETIRSYELGIDETFYAIPIRGESGALENQKLRSRNPEARRKAHGLARPSCLYPIHAITVGPRALVVCEGEFDALLLNQHGFPAVTSTAGTSWNPEWNRWVEGRYVATLYDAGSYALAAKRASEFRSAGAKDAWPVDLSRAGFATGEDVTDWFVKYGRSADDLRQFIIDARRRYRRKRRAA
jgi:hypothetical protein